MLSLGRCGRCSGIRSEVGAELSRDLRGAPFVLDAEALLVLLTERQIMDARASEIEQLLPGRPQPGSLVCRRSDNRDARRC